jgi:hypothetical protein
MTEADFRNAVRGVLHQYNSEVEDAIRRELATPFDLGHSGYLQFEVDAHLYGISLIQTEEAILESVEDPVFYTVLGEAEEAGLDWHALIGEEFFPWLADRWRAVGGPARYSPAYAFYHGGLYEPRYHLEERRWCSVEEVWPQG